MSKSAARHRRDKMLENDKPPTKSKFLEIARGEYVTPKFEAANPRQKEALAMLQAGRKVVFLTGSAGTGKSMIAAYRGARLLKEKKIDKIYLVRPAVATGKSIGLLPGTVEEKLAPYFAQTVAHLEYFLGASFTKYCLSNGIIEMRPVEYLRGTSFENCLVIFEEAQNFTEDEFEMLLTRFGNNASFIFTGDEKQHDLRGTTGLSKTLDRIEFMLDKAPEYLSDEDLTYMDELIGIVRFEPSDVVRSGLTKAFVKMYYYSQGE